MSNTTKYQIFKTTTAGDELVDTKTKKGNAVEVAREVRKAEKVGVRVVTEAGTEVFALAAPKKINMTPKYMRIAALPEDVQAQLPEGKRPVFYRKRRHAVILHDGSAMEYTILDTVKGVELEDEVFSTTRATDERLKELVKL